MSILFTVSNVLSIFRYDHFGVLAELLPSGIPSMAVDLVSCQLHSEQQMGNSNWDGENAPAIIESRLRV